MSILKVENMTQSFGERQIFNNVSFNLLKGEHIGLVGANGSGKTTFMKLITKEILPEEGIIEWNSNLKVGYMDQNVKLDSDNTVKNYLRTAYNKLYEINNKLQELYLFLEKNNNIINVVYHLENKKLTRYSGNYDKFEKLYEERKRVNQMTYINQQKEIKKL